MLHFVEFLVSTFYIASPSQMQQIAKRRGRDKEDEWAIWTRVWRYQQQGDWNLSLRIEWRQLALSCRYVSNSGKYCRHWSHDSISQGAIHLAEPFYKTLKAWIQQGTALQGSASRWAPQLALMKLSLWWNDFDAKTCSQTYDASELKALAQLKLVLWTVFWCEM